MRCGSASVFSSRKEGKTSSPISCISPPVAQTLFSAELAGILIDSNMKADKYTLKSVFLIRNVSNTAKIRW